MQTLQTIFGKSIPSPTGYQITRWGADPLARGSYSFQPVGAHPDLRKRLGSPVGGTLLFAGEATQHDYFGTAHGAYISGLRAAREVQTISIH